MTLSSDTISRYQLGGDIYNTLAGQYGSTAADAVALAAQSGDSFNVTGALAQIRDGAPLNDSTASLFVNQLINDPLQAPLDALNSGVASIFNSSGVKTIGVIVVAAVILILLVKNET